MNHWWCSGWRSLLSFMTCMQNTTEDDGEWKSAIATLLCANGQAEGFYIKKQTRTNEMSRHG